jgi:glycopeptide antibiotics resistance protein
MLTSLNSIFVWFYCLPYEDAAEYMLALGLLVIILKEYFEQKVWWKPVLGVFLIAWLGVLAYATVFSRPAGQYAPPNLILFHSYRDVNSGGSWEILLSNYMNILLFFPGGLFLSAALPRRFPWGLRILLSTVSFALFSAAMEYSQYYWHLGLVEADDVLHNTLGALLGGIFGIIQPPGRKKERG